MRTKKQLLCDQIANNTPESIININFMVSLPVLYNTGEEIFRFYRYDAFAIVN